MTAHTRLDPPLVESIRKALTANALPGETKGLSQATELEAAEFLAKLAARRKRGELAFSILSTGGGAPPVAGARGGCGGRRGGGGAGGGGCLFTEKRAC